MNHGPRYQRINHSAFNGPLLPSGLSILTWTFNNVNISIALIGDHSIVCGAVYGTGSTKRPGRRDESPPEASHTKLWSWGCCQPGNDSDDFQVGPCQRSCQQKYHFFNIEIMECQTRITKHYQYILTFVLYEILSWRFILHVPQATGLSLAQ